jgi:long-chain fatty acid transport protein
MGMSDMKLYLASASVLALAAGPVLAGGIERSPPSVAVLFEDGNYVEFSLGAAAPDVSGTVLGGRLSSGDMAPGYGTFALAYKQAVNDKLDFAVILDQPVGAKVSYPAANAPYPFAGATADIDSLAITALVRYKLPSNISIIGGLRAEQVEGRVSIPSVGGYTMTTDTDRKLGYLVGIAWEKPEIAARVALTYNSKIDHELTARESFSPVPTTFETTIPQSVNLEFQTGIAKDTLLFGSVRWVDWSDFDITPPAFFAATASSLASLDSDYVTYTLGVGRKFSEQWSGAVILGYEGASGDLQGNLGPTDGQRSIGLAATYTMDHLKITGGVRYIDIGDATTRAIGGQFTDNSAVAAGLRVGFSF